MKNFFLKLYWETRAGLGQWREGEGLFFDTKILDTKKKKKN